jgi:LysR family transcriptional activator of nhaA
MYFWMVVREGGIQQAGRRLRLAHPTISVQIKQLEESLGEQLFDRTHRKLELTEAGRVAYRYADEIFSLGREFMEALAGHPTGRPARLAVGISDAMPKLIVRNLLDPALRLPSPVRLLCLEDRYDRLLGELATNRLDVILADTPVAPSSGVKAFNHLLGECGVTFFAHPRLASKIGSDFPRSLDGAPMLLPTSTTSLGRAIPQWCEKNDLRPEVVAEFDDTALMKTFGQDSVGVFCSPSVMETEVKRQYGVEVIGRADDLREQFYAISPERRLKNPAVMAICEAARGELFAIRES